MPSNRDNTDVAQLMDVLRVMKQRGVEKALLYFPEHEEFIEHFKDWPFEHAEREILSGHTFTLHEH